MKTIVATTLVCAFGVLSAAMAGCGGAAGPTNSTNVAPNAVTALSGNGQSAISGSALAQSLVVKVTGGVGTPVAGATVTFVVTAGSATLSPSRAQTDSNGTARTQVTVGAPTGTVVVDAAVQGSTLSARFTVMSIASANPSCVTPLTLNVGAALIVTALSLCLNGGATGAQYVLVPFNGATTLSPRCFIPWCPIRRPRSTATNTRKHLSQVRLAPPWLTNLNTSSTPPVASM